MSISNSNSILNKTTVSWSGIEPFEAACLGIVILDLETLPPGENHLFTIRESEKFLRMGSQRRKSFKASRIALKELSRRLGLINGEWPDSAIETLSRDNQRPCLAESGLYCSVSHSSRFVVGVAHRHPVGVDVEGISRKIQKIQHIFLSPEEKHLIARSSLDFEVAATRVWSIKEAAAKALGLHLFQALREVKIVSLGKEESSINVQGKTYPAWHGQGEDQVIALVTCDDL